jgi:hypothetical protein
VRAILNALVNVVLALVALIVAPLVIFYGMRIVRRFRGGKSGHDQGP